MNDYKKKGSEGYVNYLKGSGGYIRYYVRNVFSLRITLLICKGKRLLHSSY